MIIIQDYGTIEFYSPKRYSILLLSGHVFVLQV